MDTNRKARLRRGGNNPRFSMNIADLGRQQSAQPLLPLVVCNIDAGPPAGQSTCKAARAPCTNQRLPYFSQFLGSRLASDKSRTARSLDESHVFPRCFSSNPVPSYPIPSRLVLSHPIVDLFMFGHILRLVTNLYPCHASCKTKSTT